MNSQSRLLPALLPVLTLCAAPVTRDDIVAKLTSHLVLLKFAVGADEPLKDGVYTAAELQSLATYSQNQAIKPFERDLIDFQLQNYLRTKPSGQSEIRLRPFVTSDQAYRLGVVLTGKDLSEANVKPLVEALVSMMDSADGCRTTHTELRDSPEFRAAAARVSAALKAFRVTDADLRNVIDSLFRGAIASSTTPPPRVTYR